MLKSYQRLFNRLFFCLLFSYTCVITAMQAKTQDEVDFFTTVHKTGGYLNQALHQAFWEVMVEKYDEPQRNKIITDMAVSLETLKSFQAQAWKSAKDSYFAKKITKTSEYDALKAQVEQQNSFYFSPQVIANMAEKIIEAAAFRTSLDLGTGKFYITPELIEENLIGLRGSYERLKLLLTPQWKEDLKEYVFPKIQMSLLSLYAPDEYNELISHNNENIAIYIAQLYSDTNSVYEIGAVDYQKHNKKFIDFTPQEKEIYLQEFVKEQFAPYKINDPLMSQGNWRDYEFAKGVASTNEMNVIIMSFFVNEKVLYIK